MACTISAFARVVTSPRSLWSEMSRSRRRMILPDRVFGRSGVKMIERGFAIAPIFVPTWLRSSSWSSSDPSYPPRRVTNAAMACPVRSSVAPRPQLRRLRGDRRAPTRPPSSRCDGPRRSSRRRPARAPRCSRPRRALPRRQGSIGRGISSNTCRRSACRLRRWTEASMATASRWSGIHRSPGDRVAVHVYDLGGDPGDGVGRRPGFVAVTPGRGEIMIPPVSVCHHVSTMGQDGAPMCS